MFHSSPDDTKVPSYFCTTLKFWNETKSLDLDWEPNAEGMPNLPGYGTGSKSEV